MIYFRPGTEISIFMLQTINQIASIRIAVDIPTKMALFWLSFFWTVTQNAHGTEWASVFAWTSVLSRQQTPKPGQKCLVRILTNDINSCCLSRSCSTVIFTGMYIVPYLSSSRPLFKLWVLTWDFCIWNKTLMTHSDFSKLSAGKHDELSFRFAIT